MFFKTSPPATRLQSIGFGVFCAACIAFVGAVFAYESWSEKGVRRDMDTLGIKIINLTVTRLRCSPDHFFGREVLLERDDLVRFWRNVCYDWKTQRWAPSRRLKTEDELPD